MPPVYNVVFANNFLKVKRHVFRVVEIFIANRTITGKPTICFFFSFFFKAIVQLIFISLFDFGCVRLLVAQD